MHLQKGFRCNSIILAKNNTLELKLLKALRNSTGKDRTRVFKFENKLIVGGGGEKTAS